MIDWDCFYVEWVPIEHESDYVKAKQYLKLWKEITLKKNNVIFVSEEYLDDCWFDDRFTKTLALRFYAKS